MKIIAFGPGIHEQEREGHKKQPAGNVDDYKICSEPQHKQCKATQSAALFIYVSVSEVFVWMNVNSLAVLPFQTLTGAGVQRQRQMQVSKKRSTV